MLRHSPALISLYFYGMMETRHCMTVRLAMPFGQRQLECELPTVTVMVIKIPMFLRTDEQPCAGREGSGCLSLPPRHLPPHQEGPAEPSEDRPQL